MKGLNPVEYLNIAKENSATINEIYDEQKKMARILFESMKLNGVVQVSQGPTGMGKTIVIMAVVKALNDIGKRVLVVAPTYNHLKDNVIKDGSLIFGLDFSENPPIMYGKSNKRYGTMIENCPRELEDCKNPLSNECLNLEKKCIRSIDHSLCKVSNIVLTVHAYIVSKSSYINEFDIVLIDESHGLPNVIRNQSQMNLSFEALEVLLKKETKPEIREELELAKSYWVKAKRRVSKGGNIPSALAARVFDPIKQAAEKSSINSELKNYKFYDIPRFSGDGRLYVSSYRRPSKWHETLSVGLISATIEDPRAHVRDCQFNSLTMRPADDYQTERFRLRFERRPIFGLIDGPRLGKGDRDNYKILRNEANLIIKKMVQSIIEVTLILCQNHFDAVSIQEELKKSEKIKDRLTILPETTSKDDLDSYEKLIQDEIDKGKNVIISTASTRLWEGANVPNLKFLIIDALPYRRLTDTEKNAEGAKRARTWKNMKRFMLNRIQQGIGRLVRTEREWGIAVIIDNRFYANYKQLFKGLPTYIVSPQIFRWVENESLVKELKNMVKKLKSGKSGRKDRDLTTY